METSDWVLLLFSVSVCHLQTWYEQAGTTENDMAAETPPPAESVTELQARLLALCRKGNTKGTQQEASVLLSLMT